MIRLADAQLLKKYFIQFIVIILPGMNQNMVCVLVQFMNHPA
jgi:hypothetical protein